MERPAHVPEGAVYMEGNKEWQLGDKNEDGQKIGQWKTWHEQGHLWLSIEYGNGTPPFHVQRFHPDGSLAQEGNWYGGQHWLGTCRWVKSEQPTPESFPAEDAQNSPTVWAAEFDFVAEGIYDAQRYFNKQGQPVCSTGLTLPNRPKQVPERAHFCDNSAIAFSKSYWVMGQKDIRIDKYVGNYDEWTATGIQAIKRVYSTGTGKELELHKYDENGNLWTTQLFISEDSKLRKYYYDDVKPPAVKETTLYSNNEKDWTYTKFDTTGQALYVIHHEVGNDVQNKRYYNDILVYEGHYPPEFGSPIPPSYSCYYYPDGAVMLKYIRNEDETEYWQFYEENGDPTKTLAITTKNRDVTKRKTIFLSDNKQVTVPEWEAVKMRFIEAYTKEETSAKFAVLPVPAFLQKELDKTDWTKLATAMRGGKDLPLYINGLLSEDQEIFDSCYGPVWLQIEHQGTLYAATYKVGSIIAKLLPQYATVPAVQLRLVSFLFEIMCLPDIDYGKTYYDEIIKPLQASAQLFMNMAADPRDEVAFKALYLLSHAGLQLPETASFLEHTWNNKQQSLFRRSYAACTLGAFYLRAEQKKTLVTTFSAALPQEEEQMIRLVLAILLVTTTKKKAQESWLAELIGVLTKPEDVQVDFKALNPFVASLDVQEYVLKVLRHASPELLEKNIVPVIDMLTGANALKQETLLLVIFSVLFAKKTAIKDLTPIRRQALLAAAHVVEQEPGFVNHAEIFRKFGLPHHAVELRLLAGK